MKYTHALFILLMSFSLNSSAFEIKKTEKADSAIRFLMQDLGFKKNADGVETYRVVQTDRGYDTAEITLNHPEAGEIKLLMKGPAGFLTRTNRSLNCIFLVSGFFTGREAVKLMGDTGNTVIVGYEYPYKMKDFATNPADLVQFVRKTPGQIALGLKYVSEQRWLEPSGLISMGVSLGGLFLPSALHMAQVLGVDVPRSIFAFTGAHLTPILEQNLEREIPSEIAQYIAYTFANLTALHDPKLHLPRLQGSFLVISADQDKTIPFASTQLLIDLLGEDKKYAVVHGPHINTDQKEVIKQTQEVVGRWLAGAL